MSDREGGGRLPEIKQEVPKPRLLDIVQIDGHWAQVGPVQDMVKFLDNPGGNAVIVDWNNYRFQKFYISDKSNVPGGSVKDLFDREMITEEEYWAIHCAGKDENPNYRGEMNIFGIYTTIH